MLLLFRNRASGGDFPPGFNPATDYWWDGSDPSTMWQDAAKTTPVGAGDPVTVWQAQNGEDLTFGPVLPTWNGSNQLAFTANIRGLSTDTTLLSAYPRSILMVVQNSLAVFGYASGTPGGGAGTFNRFSLQYRTATNVGANNGAGLVQAVLPDATVPLVMQGVFTLTNTVIRANSVENTGGGGSFVGTGLAIGALSQGISGFVRSVYFSLLPWDAAERAALEAWFAAKYGVVLP